MGDISLKIEGIKFTYRVAAIIKSPDKQKVLLHKNVHCPYFMLPGGRVKIGETAIDAIVREMKEEMNAEIKVINFVKFLELLFDISGQKVHEILIVYEIEIIEPKKIYQTGRFESLEKKNNVNFNWIRISNLDNYDLRPHTIKEKLLAEYNLEISRKKFESKLAKKEKTKAKVKISKENNKNYIKNSQNKYVKIPKFPGDRRKNKG